MPQVTVTVNKHAYAITCEPGEERHVQALAAELDRRVAESVRQLGQVGEGRLLLVTALMVLDDLAEASARGNEPAVRDGLQRLEQEAARAIEGLAQRVEAVAARLEAP